MSGVGSQWKDSGLESEGRGREGTVSGRESGLFVLKMLSVELNIDDSR